MSATARPTAGRAMFIGGGHRFPFKTPLDTAVEVARWITMLGAIRP